MCNTLSLKRAIAETYTQYRFASSPALICIHIHFVHTVNSLNINPYNLKNNKTKFLNSILI